MKLFRSRHEPQSSCRHYAVTSSGVHNHPLIALPAGQTVPRLDLQRRMLNAEARLQHVVGALDHIIMQFR